MYTSYFNYLHSTYDSATTINISIGISTNKNIEIITGLELITVMQVVLQDVVM
jgi:hypothetical protein